MTDLREVVLVWGTPGDIDRVSDGGGDYASTYRLTPRGVAKVAQALGHPLYRDAEFCGCKDVREGDGIHVAGEPVDVICLASPLVPVSADSGRECICAEPLRVGEKARPCPMHGWNGVPVSADSELRYECPHGPGCMCGRGERVRVSHDSGTN